MWIFILVYGSVMLFILWLRWPQLCSLGQSTQHFARGGFGWHACWLWFFILFSQFPRMGPGHPLPLSTLLYPPLLPWGPAQGWPLLSGCHCHFLVSCLRFLPSQHFQKLLGFSLHSDICNQVSATEDRFLFESFDSSKMNPLGPVWVVEEMMLLSLSE